MPRDQRLDNPETIGLKGRRREPPGRGLGGRPWAGLAMGFRFRPEASGPAALYF